MICTPALVNDYSDNKPQEQQLASSWMHAYVVFSKLQWTF